MGRDSASGVAAIVYGVVLKLPSDPRFDLMMKRLENFEYDRSLFATSARAAPKSDVADQGNEDVLGDIKKSARTAAKPILLDSSDPDCGEEQAPNYYNDYSNYGYDLDRKAQGAIDKVLNSEKHSVVLQCYGAGSDDEYEYDEPMDPILVLHARTGPEMEAHQPSAQVSPLGKDILTLTEAEKKDMDEQLDQIIRAFGLEIEGEKGWHLVFTVTCTC